MDSTFRTIVIHPGSRWLRIGRASDALPTTVPNVIARRSRSFVPSAGKGKQREVPLPAPIIAAKEPDIAMDVDTAYEAPVDPAVPLDPLSIKIKSIRGDLRARMSAFKLRGQGNGNLLASGYNASAQPETTGEYNDPSEVDWTDITGNNAKEVYIGAKVCLASLAIMPHSPARHCASRTLKRRATRSDDPTAPALSTRRATPLSKSCWATLSASGSARSRTNSESLARN